MGLQRVMCGLRFDGYAYSQMRSASMTDVGPFVAYEVDDLDLECGSVDTS